MEHCFNSLHPLFYDCCILVFKGQSRSVVRVDKGSIGEANAQKIEKKSVSRKKNRPR
jgi:hypothetical protein